MLTARPQEPQRKPNNVRQAALTRAASVKAFARLLELIVAVFEGCADITRVLLACSIDSHVEPGLTFNSLHASSTEMVMGSRSCAGGFKSTSAMEACRG